LIASDQLQSLALRKSKRIRRELSAGDDDGTLSAFIIQDSPEGAERHDADAPALPMLGLHDAATRRVVENEVDTTICDRTASVGHGRAASAKVLGEIGFELSPS
jgi:hypothetical protein